MTSLNLTSTSPKNHTNKNPPLKLTAKQLTRIYTSLQLTIPQSQYKIPPLPKVPELITELPQSIQPYVEMIYDVRGDGHCGYRAISACLGRGPDGFMQIRQTILEKIQNRRQWYQRDPATTKIQEWEKSLVVPHSGPCPVDKWMVMPVMAVPIANALETSVFFFSLTIILSHSTYSFVWSKQQSTHYHCTKSQKESLCCPRTQRPFAFPCPLAPGKPLHATLNTGPRLVSKVLFLF
ncbi:hypothetical protein VP01_8392g1 [Puccinia sorghi]|uniref:OTU domain-containing protein n=1 Tax=Puccinia sorghi TaxID=27349 RepID=A0A0L6U9G8_9BASI|nr:hypothetical protein VP01_8392g1 [Puccinia sorghi]